MLLYLAAQNGVFFYGTFFVWSWDIMEPIAYFWGQCFIVLCFAYFIRSERECGFGGVQERTVDAKRRRRYRREGFDIDKYERDCAAVELYRERIRALEKERIQNASPTPAVWRCLAIASRITGLLWACFLSSRSVILKLLCFQSQPSIISSSSPRWVPCPLFCFS